MRTGENTGVRRQEAEEAILRLFVVEYEHGCNRNHTVVSAYDVESAKRQFRRDNPHVEMVSCV